MFSEKTERIIEFVRESENPVTKREIMNGTELQLGSIDSILLRLFKKKILLREYKLNNHMIEIYYYSYNKKYKIEKMRSIKL